MSMRIGMAIALGAGLLAPPIMSAPASPQLAPLVYVCPMPADAAVIADKPGKCPVCGMTLVPTRLEAKWWCPTHQTLVVRDAPGKCPLDGKALVQVTVAEHWTCPEHADVKLETPRACANGQPSKVVYEARAHGDHNPRHDGQFFMASDAWHHLEGTYPKAGLFRAYFYDNFTKPIPAGDFSGSLVVLDKNDKELGSFPLTHAAGGTLEAAIPVTLAALPLKAAAKVRFAAAIPEQRFDFYFSGFSHDPAAAVKTPPLAGRSQPGAGLAAGSPAAPKPPAPSAGRAGDSAGRKQEPAVRSRATTAGVGTVPTVAASAPPAVTASSAASASSTPVVLDSPLNIPPALADALDESKLPRDTAGLVAELASRAKQVETLINQGSLAEVWLPASGTKTAALVLDRRADTLPPASRARVNSAIKRVIVDSWALDNYGDLGSRDKIAAAYSDLASAIAELQTLYAAAP
jgi:heavy metal-binding protein